MTALFALAAVIVGLSIDVTRLRLAARRPGRHAAPGRAARRLIDGRHMRAHYQKRHA